MKREDIEKIIPHRESMLLLDEVELIDGLAYGQKSIVGNEWFIKGHFPDNPVVPGVILCEILAQSVCVCLSQELVKDKLPMFIGLDKVKFRTPVKPGDTFRTKCEIIKERSPFYFAKGVGYVKNRECVSAEFSFALIDNNNVKVGR